jgi:hypothetical protein
VSDEEPPVIDDPGLFDLEVDPVVFAARRARVIARSKMAGLSTGQRLTIRQRMDVAHGIHPLTKEPTHPELGTCGGCVFKQVGNDHGWNKCTAEGTPKSRGPATDVRAWWPACRRFVSVPPPTAVDGG